MDVLQWTVAVLFCLNTHACPLLPVGRTFLKCGHEGTRTPACGSPADGFSTDPQRATARVLYSQDRDLNAVTMDL